MAETRHLGIPRALVPWYPVVDLSKCNGCGLCATSCKHGVSTLDTDKVVIANPLECVVFCQSCEYVCEPEAISHPPKESVKAIIKELRKQFPAY